MSAEIGTRTVRRTTIGVVAGVALGLAIAVAGYFLFVGRPAQAGPYGGDLVPLPDENTRAEVLANEETGEVLIHTWDKDLNTRRPIESEPLVIGSGEKSTQLMPHPVESDPDGSCSRFYRQADWVRGGGSRQGWVHRSGHAEHRAKFTWQRCWPAGQAHGHMWTEIGERRHMGPGHGPGHQRGRGEQ